MPLFVIRESDLAQRGEAIAIRHKLMSLMMFPQDANARLRYEGSELLKAAHLLAKDMEEGTTVSLTTPTGLILGDADLIAREALSPAVRRPEKAEPLGISPQGIAGLVLIQAFSFQDRGDPDISLTRCIDALVEILRIRQLTLGSTKQNIKEVWHKYRPVAHIAAAMIVGFKKFDGGAWFGDPSRFVEFVRTANTMKARGEAIRHKKATDPILLPGEGWEFAIVPCSILARTGSKNSEPGPVF